MLTCKRQNFYRSKLLSPGAMGHIVVAYPLCDNVRPYSIGIHTCWVRFLDNCEVKHFSGIWFQSNRRTEK